MELPKINKNLYNSNFCLAFDYFVCLASDLCTGYYLDSQKYNVRFG